MKRYMGLPEGEMAIIPDMDTLIHNIVTSELKEKDEEIQRLNNKLDMIKKNINTISKEQILDIIENYTGFWGKPDE